MDPNANSGASGATDTSSVTAIKVQVVLDTTTAQLKQQFAGIQTDIEKDPIGLTFGVDKKTSKDAIIKGLQEILGNGANITIGAGVDPNAGNQVKKQVQNAANAGQQAANKNKVKIKVQTDVDTDTKDKISAYYKRIQQQVNQSIKIARLKKTNPNSKEYRDAVDIYREQKRDAAKLRSELGDKIPTYTRNADDYSKEAEIRRAGRFRVRDSLSSLEASQQRNAENTAKKNAKAVVDAEFNAKKSALFERAKEIGKARTQLETLERGTPAYDNAVKNLRDSKAGYTALRHELGNKVSTEEYSRLSEIFRQNDRDVQNARVNALTKAIEAASKTSTKAQSEADAKLAAQAKYGISQFNDEMTKHGKLSMDQLALSYKNGGSSRELTAVDSLENESRENLEALKDYLAGILPQDQLDAVLQRYDNFERELSDKLYRAKQHYEDLKNARDSANATAEEKRQAKQTDTYTDDLATARNKYKNMSGVPVDVSGALDSVDTQIKKLDTLTVGTEDYANQLKAIGTAWADATRQMDAFDKAQKDTENHVKSMTEQALKWQKSISGNTEEADSLRKSIQRILSIEKSLNPDHSSDKYAKGVAAMDDAFIDAKASMSAYKSEYKNLESQATSTLTKIRKAEMQLAEANNTAFDNLLKGQPGYIGNQDRSFEGRIRELNEMDSQSEQYRTTLKGIQDDWQKISLQIQQALKSEEDLAKEATQRQNQIRSQQKAYNSIMKTLGTADFTDKDSRTKAFFETNVNNDTKRTGAQAVAELQSEMAKLSETQPPAEYEQTLKNIKDLVVEINKQINEARNSSSNVRADNTKNNHMQDLMRELYSYREKLIGLEGNQKLSEEYESLFNAIKNGSLSFDEAQLKVSAFKNACHSAGLETETLGQKLSRLFKEHFQTAIAMAGVAMVKQGLREVYNNVVDIDDAMVELKKVTTESTEAYSQFSDRAAKTSRDLGASISDYVSATADWARLGYGLPDAEELARVSTLFANVGDGIENIADASSYMISILKGFDLAADDAQKVADLINEVANNEPASASDISEILTRSGAALHEAGNDLSQAISLGVAMNSVTQNAESTGQTLKTVSMYLRAAKTDLENMGESSDGCANSVSELRSELKQLTGVDIMKDAAGTQFKSTYDILKEISEVWGSLTDVTRANVTEMLGGKRNANAVAAVLSQFEIAEKSMKDAANSAGSAAKENEVYLSSITGKLAQLDSAFQQLSQDLLDSSLIKFFVDFATAAVDIADGAVKAAGALPTLTAAISGVLSVMQMSGKLKNGAGKVNMPSYICCV